MFAFQRSLLRCGVIFLFSVFLMTPLAFAHAEKQEALSRWSDPVFYLIITAIWVAALTLFIFLNSPFIKKRKMLFFLLMCAPIVFATLYLGIHTVTENLTSLTKGPVHWHADYEIYVCGNHVELVDPEGLRNKIGSPVFHEHNDNRIHIEGTVQRLEYYTLGAYFQTIGGRLTADEIIFPGHEGMIAYKNGLLCPEEYRGTLNVYVNGKRIADPENYLVYPDGRVPPGDCIIITFDASTQETTNILCESWRSQGWSYDNFQRRPITIGGKTWQ